MFQTKVVEKIKIDILRSLTFFFFDNRAVYEAVSKHSVDPGTSHLKTWRMRIACGIPKVTNIHSEYVIRIPFPQQQWLQERASLLCYTYIACLVILLFVKPFHS